MNTNQIDKASKLKAYKLFNSELFKNFKHGTIDNLQKIHKYIFDGLYDFAGMIRDRDIMKGGFRFTPSVHLRIVLGNINQMPESNLDEIVEKYVCMNIAHPFMEGNGRSTRIWLDLILKKNLHKVVDWSKIGKNDYMKAMIISHADSTKIYELIKNALTDKINDKNVYIKGIDYSYYYEGLEM